MYSLRLVWAGQFSGQFSSRGAYTIFPHTGPKVPHSRPAPKRKYGIFGLGVRKNSIRSTGVKLASPHLVFATNLLDLWTVQVFFTIPWPKVPLSLPAPKRECGIFGPDMMKNRIRNMEVKRATPEHMFATLAFGSGGNLHELWTGQLFTSIVV